jgi:hypothetical protein
MNNSSFTLGDVGLVQIPLCLLRLCSDTFLELSEINVGCAKYRSFVYPSALDCHLSCFGVGGVLAL